MKAKPVKLTVVKLCDNERRGAHPLCMIEGYCCFERAYQMGRLDEREGRPYPSQAMRRAPTKPKAKGQR